MTNSTTIQMPEVTFHSTSPYINNNMVSCGASYSPASYGPHRSSTGDDDWLDWGEGDGESGTIIDPNGNHGGEAVPVGNATWPLMACLVLYITIQHICNHKKYTL